MRASLYTYYDLEGVPCRIATSPLGELGAAEIYKAGVGFVPGPKAEILHQAEVIDKRRCEALILARAAARRAAE